MEQKSCKGSGSEHQLTIDDKPASWADFKTIEKMGKTFGIKNIREIIENTIEAKLTLLPRLALEYGLPLQWTNDILTSTAPIDHNLKEPK